VNHEKHYPVGAQNGKISYKSQESGNNTMQNNVFKILLYTYIKVYDYVHDYITL
jgi:hypothetical protein